MAWASLVIIGASILEGIGTVVAEAFVDTTVDFVIDGVDEVVQKAMPNFQNQYVKQFTNQIRMGASTATNARIMGAALRSQNNFEGKMALLKKKADDKYKNKRESIKNGTAGIRFGAGGAALKTLDENYHREKEHLTHRSRRYTEIRSSSATESSAFSNGTGNLKQGHDGTIQNLKGNPNADLVVSINRLLNAMGNYADKEGVIKI